MKIIATDIAHLKKLIKKETQQNGPSCSLNYIDVYKITDMTGLFYNSDFNGDISQWDVSNVKDMSYMFYYSKFDGEINNWNVSRVMTMFCMFSNSKFTHDLSDWTTYCLEDCYNMFDMCVAPLPYWSFLPAHSKEKTEVIKHYIEKKELKNKLDVCLNDNPIKKYKVKI